METGNTYLRFTKNFDSESNSYLKTGSMDKSIKLDGVCAFNIDIFDLSESEIENKIKLYAKNFSYYNEGVAVIFESEYLQNGNEGIIVRPIRKIKTYYL
jgi:hypothetical protein